MTIKPIKTNKDYQQALMRLEVIFDSKKGSPEGKELDELVLLIQRYEDVEEAELNKELFKNL